MKKRSVIAAVILSGMLLLSGCGSGKYAGDEAMSYDAKSSGAYTQASTNGGAFYTGAEYATADMEKAYMDTAETAAAPPQVGEGAQVSSRKLIRNVYMDVETREFDELMIFVEDSVKSAGGYIENSYSYYGSEYRGGRNARNASLTLRIPASGLDSFINDVGGRANVISRNENVNDVTLTYVDMESHRNALRTEEESLLNMLAKAETVEDLITIESRLSDVRYQIESMESQLRTYDNMVDYATLTLSISEVEELTPVVEQSAWEKMGTGFMNSLHNIGRGLKDLGIKFVMNLPYILVWAVVIAAVFLAGRALIRKLIRKIRAKSGKDVAAVKKEASSEAPAQDKETAEENASEKAGAAEPAESGKTEKS